MAKLRDGAILKVNRNYDPAGMLRAEYAAITSGEPVVRSDFAVYLDGRTMSYTRTPCREQDTTATFFLRVVPADTDDLPAFRKIYGYDNLDFNFEQYGLTYDGKCWAEIELPQYDFAAIRTGQWISGQGNVWEGEYIVAE